MTQIVSQCALCQHFRRFEREKTVCLAFPNGIPARILENRTDHRRPVPGDHGIRWLLRPDDPYGQHPLALEGATP